MLEKDFNHMKRYYNLVPLASIKEQHPNVPWRGYLFGYVFVKENGDIYDGEWKVFKSRSVLNGRYMFHGEGIYYFGSLDQYFVGPLAYSLCNGHGQFIWVKSGEVWTNNFDPTPGAPFNGLPFDYHGDALDESRHGQATITFKNGETLQTTWNHGKLMSQGPCSVASSTVDSAAGGKGKRKRQTTDTRPSAKRQTPTLTQTKTTTSCMETKHRNRASRTSEDDTTCLDMTSDRLALRKKQLKDLFSEGLIPEQVYLNALKNCE